MHARTDHIENEANSDHARIRYISPNDRVANPYRAHKLSITPPFDPPMPNPDIVAA